MSFSSRLWSILAVWLLLCALPQKPALAQTIAPEDLHIVIEGSRVEINGVPIEWPVQISKITKILGEKPRIIGDSYAWIWDDYGFKFLPFDEGTKEDRYTKGNELTIHIREKAPFGKYTDATFPHAKHNFRGTLIIDGVQITPQLTISEFNARKRGRPFHQRPQKWKFKSFARIEGKPVPAVLKFYANVYDDLTIRYISIWYKEHKPLSKEERREIENLDIWGMPKRKVTPMTEEEKRFLMQVAPVARYLMIQDGMDRLTALTYLIKLMGGRTLPDTMPAERRALAERYIEAAEQKIREDASIIERAIRDFDEEMDGLDAFLREQHQKRQQQSAEGWPLD